MQDAATAPGADGRSGATPVDRPAPSEMLGEVADLSAGLGTVLLPLFLPAVPGFILFFVLPAVLLIAVVAAPLVVLGAIAGPAYLLARAIRRSRSIRRSTRGCRICRATRRNTGASHQREACARSGIR